MLLKDVSQPTHGSTIATIDSVLSNNAISHLDIACAYITGSGFDCFLSELADDSRQRWYELEKRWITSFDYLRTDPFALKAILQLNNSQIKIHDPISVINKKGNPLIPFHPKTYIFQDDQYDSVLSGSGNMSRSGLSKGYEAGLLVRVRKPNAAGPSNAQSSILNVKNWYNQIWENATTLDDDLLGRYRDIYDSTDNLSNPTPTEDDTDSGYTGGRSLTADDLKKLRVCRHLWIESGNITKNRGKNLPGNQLMMKRLSRVFFGVPPIAVPEDSLLKWIELTFENKDPKQCSLTYSNNKMDKLTLPIPGDAGPVSYDQKFLLFSQTGTSNFKLTLGTKSDKSKWLKRSKALGADFKMSSGRSWGVF